MRDCNIKKKIYGNQCILPVEGDGESQNSARLDANNLRTFTADCVMVQYIGMNVKRAVRPRSNRRNTNRIVGPETIIILKQRMGDEGDERLR